MTQTHTPRPYKQTPHVPVRAVGVFLVAQCHEYGRAENPLLRMRVGSSDADPNISPAIVSTGDVPRCVGYDDGIVSAGDVPRFAGHDDVAPV